MASIMDRFTLLHAGSGLALGVGAYYAMGASVDAVIAVAACLVAWECIELYGTLRQWKCGPIFDYESFANRWIGDLVVGGSCALLSFSLLDSSVIDVNALYYFLGGYCFLIVLQLACERGEWVTLLSMLGISIAVYLDSSDSTTLRYLTHPLLAALGCCLSYHWIDANES